MCNERGVLILPVALNVPRDCAIATEMWPETPLNRSIATGAALIGFPSS